MVDGGKKLGVGMKLDNERSGLCKFCGKSVSPEIYEKCVRFYQEQVDAAWDKYNQTLDMQEYIHELRRIGNEDVRKKNKEFNFEANFDIETPFMVRDCGGYSPRKITGD